jgi:hypothetical protein
MYIYIIFLFIYIFYIYIVLILYHIYNMIYFVDLNNIKFNKFIIIKRSLMAQWVKSKYLICLWVIGLHKDNKMKLKKKSF